VLANARQQQVAFPVFTDAQVGLAACASCDELLLPAVEQDADVASDEDVLDLAIKRCSADFLATKRYLPLDPLRRRQSIQSCVKNCSVAQRVAHPEAFTRSGTRRP
jgi:hypothetical protein